MNASIPIRAACPPGACDCGLDDLLEDPNGDHRVLRLTREEEKRLVARLENITTLADLRRMQARMHELLGIAVSIAPSPNEVRTVRGFSIQVQACPGLCRKTRQTIPAAIRRCLERQPEVGYELLNERDLLRDA